LRSSTSLQPAHAPAPSTSSSKYGCLAPQDSTAQRPMRVGAHLAYTAAKDCSVCSSTHQPARPLLQTISMHAWSSEERPAGQCQLSWLTPNIVSQSCMYVCGCTQALASRPAGTARYQHLMSTTHLIVGSYSGGTLSMSLRNMSPGQTTTGQLQVRFRHVSPN